MENDQSLLERIVELYQGGAVPENCPFSGWEGISTKNPPRTIVTGKIVPRLRRLLVLCVDLKARSLLATKRSDAPWGGGKSLSWFRRSNEAELVRLLIENHIRKHEGLSIGSIIEFGPYWQWRAYLPNGDSPHRQPAEEAAKAE